MDETAKACYFTRESMDTLVLLLTQYGYLILMPLAVAEGPMVTIIAGLFVTLGIFNPVIVYIIVVAGDAIGDSFLYGLGRWGGEVFFARWAPRLGVTPRKMEQVKRYFDVHGKKTIALSKVLHGVGITGLIAAGSLKVPYQKFIAISSLVSLVQVAVFLAIGILFGHAYLQIARYLNYFAAGVLITVLVVAIFLYFRKFKIR